MNLFKRELLPFDNMKLAEVDIDKSDDMKWADEIDEYMQETFPSMQEHFYSVIFEKKDPEAGDAIGKVIYENGDITFYIPILIEAFKMKEPDIALYEGKAIPLDENYINGFIGQSEEMGEIMKNYNQSDSSDFLGSIFEVTPTSQNGNPMHGKFGAKALPETIEKVKEAFLSMPKKMKISDRAENIIKNAESIYGTKVTDYIKVASASGLPYHYDGAIMSKDHFGNFTIKQFDNAPEYKLAEEMLNDPAVSNDEFLHITEDAFKDTPMGIRKLTESGKADIMDGEGMVNAVVISNPPLVEGGKARHNFAQAEKDHRAPNEGQIWQYGKLHGVPTGSLKDCYSAIDVENVKDNLDMNSWVVFRVGDAISAPYKVLKYENYAIGENSEKTELVDVENIDGNSFRFWMNRPLLKAIKANKQKLESGKYRSITDTKYDIIAIPSGIEFFKLKGKRTEPVEAIYKVKEMINDKIASFPATIKLIHNAGDNYDIIVSSKKHGEYVYEDFDKYAAELVARNFMGPVSLGEIKVGEEIEIMSDVPAEKRAGYPLGANRGELVKFAGWLRNNEYIQKVCRQKEASIEDLANDLIGVEYVDEGNIEDAKTKIPAILETLSMIGELLLSARFGKVDLEESVLKKAFKSLTAVANEIMGNVSL